MPKQASLLESGVPLDSPLEGHLLWDFASTTPGTARSSLFYFILQAAIHILLNFLVFFAFRLEHHRGHRPHTEALQMDCAKFSKNLAHMGLYNWAALVVSIPQKKYALI